MTQGWAPPPADPGYRVDGALPPGFDVAGILGQLYGGQRLTRGMAIPLGGATVTITAEYLDVPPGAPSPLTPPPAYAPSPAPPAFPAAPAHQPYPAPPTYPTPAPPAPNPGGLTPPPGITTTAELLEWMRSLRQGGQVTGSVVSVGGGPPQTFALGPQPVAGTDLRSLIATMAAGVTASSMLVGGASTHGDIHGVLDRLITTMNARTLERVGGLGRLLGGQAGGGESIRAHDPAFTEAGLIAEANAALWALTAARAESKPDALRRHLSPPLHEREARQIQMDGAQGRRRIVEGLEVRSATIDECGAGALGDHATVRFRLYGADRDVDHHGKRVGGDKKPSEWHELWTLARVAGSTTPQPGAPSPPCATCGFAGADPAADRCPGCGHPLPPAPGRWLVSGIMRVEPRHS